MPKALGLTEDFADQGRVAVILGDNIFEDDISGYVKNFEKQEWGSKIISKKGTCPAVF